MGRTATLRPGDNIFSFSVTIDGAEPGGLRVFPIAIADAQARTANASINLTITAAPPPADHLIMGNPSNAVTDIASENNYLMSKAQYALSYNRSRGNPELGKLASGSFMARHGAAAGRFP